MDRAGPLGNARVRFAPDNEFGANGDGAEVMFTLLKQASMSDEQFAADAAWVERILPPLNRSWNPQTTHQTTGKTMANKGNDRRIDYIEFNVTDIAASKAFYGNAFGWTFTDYGPEYCEFADGRLTGGFTTFGPVRSGGPLVIIYADDLEGAQARVEAAGGKILKPVFTFPGGRRFHFADPDGYELAVWSSE